MIVKFDCGALKLKKSNLILKRISSSSFVILIHSPLQFQLATEIIKNVVLAGIQKCIIHGDLMSPPHLFAPATNVLFKLRIVR